MNDEREQSPTTAWSAAPGEDLRQQSIWLAGWLAERGVQSLHLHSAAGIEELHARVTDLPALLQTLAPADRVDAGTIEIRRNAAASLSWRPAPKVGS
ncbi:MAG: hypothetical protein SFY96_01040 [Planctomycetota bacterium]|nr:hypothetical protein [Planctomycetota bacterium]